MSKLTLKDVSDVIMFRETTRTRENNQKLRHDQKWLVMLLDVADVTSFNAQVLNFVHHETKYACALGVPTAHVDAASTIPGMQIPGGNWYRWVDEMVWTKWHNLIPSIEELLSAVQLLQSVGLDVMTIPVHSEHNGNLREWPFHLHIFYSKHNRLGDPVKSLLSDVFPHALWHARVPHDQCVLDMSHELWGSHQQQAEPRKEDPAVGALLQSTATAFRDKEFAIAQMEAKQNRNALDCLWDVVESLLNNYKP